MAKSNVAREKRKTRESLSKARRRRKKKQLVLSRLKGIIASKWLAEWHKHLNCKENRGEEEE